MPGTRERETWEAKKGGVGGSEGGPVGLYRDVTKCGLDLTLFPAGKSGIKSQEKKNPDLGEKGGKEGGRRAFRR